MTVMEDIEEDLPEAVKPWVPRVITGGKGPSEPPTEDWLSPLELGTTFVALPTGITVEFNLYHVVFKDLPEVVLLAWRLPDGKMLDVYVEPSAFCKKHSKYKILGTQPVANEENDDDECNRTDRLGDVVLHEAVQGVDQVVPVAEGPDLPDGDRG